MMVDVFSGPSQRKKFICDRLSGRGKNERLGMYYRKIRERRSQNVPIMMGGVNTSRP
jgi:hypothetical protein